jgi:Ras-related protein Rab-11A
MGCGGGQKQQQPVPPTLKMNNGNAKQQQQDDDEEANSLYKGLQSLQRIKHSNFFFFIYSVVVTGDASVGKTNIITRFTTNEFDSNHKATIGVEFGHVEVTLKNEKKVQVQIWDTGQMKEKEFKKPNTSQLVKKGFEPLPGGEFFNLFVHLFIPSRYYRGALGAIIVYDITQPNSFRNVEKWLQELVEYADPDTGTF